MFWTFLDQQYPKSDNQLLLNETLYKEQIFKILI